jgi:hypothetical protein
MAGIIENGVVKVRFVTPMSVVSNQPVFVADSLSLKRQVISQGVQRWEIETNLEPSNNSADFLLHSVSNGYEKVFDIQVPQVYKRYGNTDSAEIVSVSSNAAVGDDTISVVSNGTLSKGEFIRFTNHDKLYLLMSDLTTGGNSNVKIFPKLRSSVPLNTVVVIGKSVVMKARYGLNTVLGISYIDGVLSDPGTVTFIEAL